MKARYPVSVYVCLTSPPLEKNAVKSPDRSTLIGRGFTISQTLFVKLEDVGDAAKQETEDVSQRGAWCHLGVKENRVVSH